jgi:hypothetical protein
MVQSKGLASESTRRIILSATEKDDPTIPDLFWCGDSLRVEDTDQCCFWHYIFYPNLGPERDGIYHPLYEYEIELLQALQNERHVCVYKATGLGITEFMLLWLIWKCYTDEFFYGKESIIITGPNVDLAQGLIRRTKRFLYDKGAPYTDHGVYELEINGGTIKCYPSNNISSARGKPKVSFFFGDEAAFFKLRDDSIVRTVGERYIGKNNAYVIWVSTAGEEPAGFFYDIMLESENETIYKRFHYYVEAGLKQDPQTGTSIFNKEYIDKASESRSYAREFLGEWGKNVGDIFEQEALDEVCREDYRINPSDDSFDRIIGVDPGYGSSEYGVVAIERSGGKYTVIYATSYERTSYIDAIAKVDKVANEFNIRKIFVDKSAPEVIKDLRDKYKYNVTGIAFNEYGDRMLAFASQKVNKLETRIHPAFKKLRNQLMTIKLNKKGLPDKTKQNSFDLGDAFLLALWYYKMGSGVIYGVY